MTGGAAAVGTAAAPEEQRQEVLAAAADLVDAFGRHDTEGYFGCFAESATFLFHNHGTRLGSRADYQRLWRQWEDDDGFTVVACESTHPAVQLVGDGAAVFTHDVRTTVRTRAGQETTRERETIVFERTPRGWVAVHEHLSAPPPRPGRDRAGRVEEGTVP